MAFTTDPLEPEEAVRATLRFALSGDVDLVNTAEIQVSQINRGQPLNVFNNFTHDSVNATVFGAFINPRIVDLLPAGAEIVPIEMNAALRVTFGENNVFSRVFNTAYTLFLDRTPPTISIVSPENGDFIPLGERTDVLIQSFDRYGIETVEVARGNGAFQVLTNPNVFPLHLDEVTAEEFSNGIIVTARATDPNANQNTTSVTVFPFNPEDGAPLLEILSPENGSTFQEGEPVTFEVRLRNVSSAELFLDVGGIETANPVATINRSQDGDERQFVTATIPAVNEDIVVLARLQQGNLRGFAFLNVIDDDGIEAQPEILLSPETRLLTGTEWLIRGQIPAAIDDFSDRSEILLADPIDNAAPLSVPMNSETRFGIGGIGSQASAEAILRDRSGNESRETFIVDKIPYLTDAPSVVALQGANPNQVFAHAAFIPGLDDSSELLMAINGQSGGFVLRHGTQIVGEMASGRVDALLYGGSGFVAQMTTEGNQELRFYPQRSGTATSEGLFAPPVTLTALGDVVAVSGNLVWVSHGELLSAYTVSETGWVETAGINLAEAALEFQAINDGLLVLTGSGLYQYGLAIDGIPRVEQRFFSALPNQFGFSLNGDELTVWNEHVLSVFTLLNDGSLIASANNQTTLASAPDQHSRDGGLLWLAFINSQGDREWHAFLGNELVGRLPLESTRVWITPGRFYYVDRSNGAEQLRFRTIAVSGETVEPTISLVGQPLAIELTVDATNTALVGQTAVSVFNLNGVLLPHRAHLSEGVWRVSVPRNALTALDTELQLRIETHQSARSVNVIVDTTLNAAFDNVIPDAVSVLNQGARTPVVLTIADNARITDAAITSINDAAMGFADNLGYQWLQLPVDASETSYDLFINNAVQPNSPINVNLQSNDTELASVIIAQPINNSRFREGDIVEVSYQVNNGGGDNFRYADIGLFDFNNNLLGRVLSIEDSGRLSIRLPTVDQQDVLTLRIRAYFGDALRYSESEVGLRVSPQFAVPEPILTGVTAIALAGSQVNYSVSMRDENQFQTRIEVFDDQAQLLAADGRRLQLIVPADSDILRVVATAFDNFGNTRQIEREVQVRLRRAPSVNSEIRQFSVMLPDVAEVWFANGRDLIDAQGNTVASFESNISALSRIGDRLLIGLEGRELLIIDPQENFQVLSNHPVSGVATNFALRNERLLAIIDDQLAAFTFRGNAISDAILNSRQNPGSVSRSNFSADELAIDIATDSNGFVVLQSDSLIRFDHEFVTTASERISLEGTVAMAVYEDYVFVSRDNGSLHALDSRGNDFVNSNLGFQIDALLPFGRELVALSTETQRLSLLDVSNPRNPQLIGQYTIPITSQVDRADTYAGRLWLGGDNGRVIDIADNTDNGGVVFIARNTRGFSRDIAIDNGQIAVAADSFSTVLYEFTAGQWRDTHLDGPPTHVVAVDDGKIYIGQRDSGRVVVSDVSQGISSASQQQAVFTGLFVENLTLTETMVAATQANQVHLALKDNLSVTGVVEVGAGEDIISLVAHGETLYASTNNGRLYRIVPGNLPIDTFLVDVSTIIDGAVDIIESLTVSGDYLFYRIGNNIFRLNLATFQDQVVQIGGTGRVSAMVFGGDQVYVADTSGRIHTIDVPTWVLIPEQSYQIGRAIVDMAYENGTLVLALGNFGIQIIEIGNAATAANPALLFPSSTDIFVQGETLTMSLTETALINSVRYYIDGLLIAGTSEAPFAIETLVPPYLRNGQPFSIEAEVETVDGTIIRSNARRALLQGQDLPGNAFRAVINTPRAGVPTFVPRPLEIRADVLNSSQPVFQVEFLESDFPDREFRTIGRHFGPEFVIFRTFGLEDSGKYLRVRAVDEFGNVTESPAVQVIRQEDNLLPSIGNFAIDGPTAGPNEIVAEHDFVISMPVNDLESGLQSAIMFRGNVIVAAIFENGTLRFTETTAQANTEVTYRVVATDIAGNVSQRSQTYTIIEDVAPTITVNPIDPIIEQGRFTVSYRAQDLVEVSSVEVEWNGFVETRTFNTANTGQITLPIRDRRAERVTGTTREELIIRAIDDIGQVAEQRIPVEIVVDQIPDASRLNVAISSNAFYNSRESISLSNIRAANDGNDPVLIELVEIAPSEGEIIQRFEQRPDRNGNFSTLSAAIQLPTEEISDNNYRFRVRITDHLGQQSETDEFSIALTQLPNELRFFRTGDQLELNPILVTVGTTVFYQIEVVDAGNRRVPNQQIEWTLTPITDNGGTSAPITMGSTVSNAEGLSVLNLDSTQYVGLNTLTARLTSRPLIRAQRRIRFETGETVELRFAPIAKSQAGDTTVVSVTAHDAGGNMVAADSVSQVQVRLPHEGFHFGFANGLRTQLLPGGGEVAVLTLNNGRIDVPITVPSERAVYLAPVSIAGDSTNTNTTVTYQSGPTKDSVAPVSLLPIEVVANDPFAVNLELTTVANHPLGDPERLEAGETVTVTATLIDQFFNRVDSLDPLGNPSDANLSLQLTVDGNATFAGTGQATTIAINQGVGTVEVTNDAVETVTVSAAAIDPILATVRDLGTLELNFLKRPPAITRAEFTTAINSMITPLELAYTEPVTIEENSDGLPNRVSLGAAPVAGSFAVATNTDGTGRLIFTPENQVLLDRTYNTDSTDSTLRGVAANDEVLVQQLDVQSHEALINIPENRFVLEGTNYPFTMQLAAGIDVSNLAGNAEISRILSLDPPDVTDSFEARLNFSSPSINVPTHSTAGLEDGQQILVAILGNLEGDGPGIPSRRLRTGNQIALTVLQRGADKDYDGDGLSNELEFATEGLDPANPDSDGDGINDGDDDLDNDGLSNRDEVIYQTSLTNADSDNDGVIDGDEVFIYGSNPLAGDTDGDGISDFIEVSSDSDPTNPFDSFVDPLFVTAIAVTPNSLTAQLGIGSNEAQLQVIATFEFQGRIESVDITALIDLVSYRSSDISIATVNTIQPGLITFVGAGTTDITVDFVENIALSQTIPVAVEAATEEERLLEPRIRIIEADPAQTLYRGADYGEVAFDIISGADFYIEEAVLDGSRIDVAVSDAFCEHETFEFVFGQRRCTGTTNFIHLDTVSGDNGVNEDTFLTGHPNGTRYVLVMPEGVPLTFSGSLELVGFAQGEFGYEPFSISTQLNVADDPETSIAFSSGQGVGEVLTLIEGEAVELPTIVDQAFNNLTVETLLDGEPVSCGQRNYIDPIIFEGLLSDTGGQVLTAGIANPGEPGYFGPQGYVVSNTVTENIFRIIDRDGRLAALPPRETGLLANIVISIEQSQLTDGPAPMLELYTLSNFQSGSIGDLAGSAYDKKDFVTAQSVLQTGRFFGGVFDIIEFEASFDFTNTNRLSKTFTYPFDLSQDGFSILSLNGHEYVIERLSFEGIDRNCVSQLERRRVPLEFRDVYDVNDDPYRVTLNDVGKQISYRVTESRAVGLQPRVYEVPGAVIDVTPALAEGASGSMSAELLEPAQGQLYDIDFGANVEGQLIFPDGQAFVSDVSEAITNFLTGIDALLPQNTGRHNAFADDLGQRYAVSPVFPRYEGGQRIVVRIPQATENSALYIRDNAENIVTEVFDSNLGVYVPIFRKINNIDFEYMGSLFDLKQSYLLNGELRLAFDPDCAAPPDGPVGGIDTSALEFVNFALILVPDPAPLVTLPSDPKYTVRRFGTTTFDLTVSDPGRNIAYIRALSPSFDNGDLFGELHTNITRRICEGVSICANDFSSSIDLTNAYHLSERDELSIQLPVTTNLRTGIYPLYFMVFDTTGNFTVIESEVRVLERIPPAPPNDNISPPFRAIREAFGFESVVLEFEISQAGYHTLWLETNNFGLGNTLSLFSESGQRLEFLDSCSVGESSFSAAQLFNLVPGSYRARISVFSGEGSFGMEGQDESSGYILNAERTSFGCFPFFDQFINHEEFGVQEPISFD